MNDLKTCPSCAARVLFLITEYSTGKRFCHNCISNRLSTLETGTVKTPEAPSATYQARACSIAWHELSADMVKPGKAAFLAKDGSLHTCDASAIDAVRLMDEDAQILARSPEEWKTFVIEQRLIFLYWCERQTFTEYDSKWLREMGIAWK
jgi:hypothetical protein